ncbi:hypothetical protein AtEden1_Chr1g0043051 [Arabidopsis thaliana]
MQRCLVLHDIQSQSQHSARQRREQLIHEHGVDEEGEDYSDSDSGNMPETEVPETQEEEEVYRVTIDDDESTARRGSSAQRFGGSSLVSIGSGSRRSHRRQSFETTIQDSITGFREFQRQSFQQLRPGAFDQDDYDEFKKAEAIFIALNLPKHTRFHWACINALKELVFWRKYLIDITASNDEDKVQLLEAMTGVSRNNQDVPKQLGSSHSFGSPHSGGISSGSPSSVGNWEAKFTQFLGSHLSIVGNTTKRCTMENTTKCTVGHATKCSTVGIITKGSTMAANRKFLTRWFKRNDSNKCSIWIFSWKSRRLCNN